MAADAEGTELNLEDALIGAAEAPRLGRIHFRDPVARHGAAAVAALEPWIRDPELAPFAVVTIARAADYGARVEAVQALRRALRSPISALVEADIRAALARLGAVTERPTRKPSRQATPRTPSQDVDLVVGHVYKRRDLHGAFGGSPQGGISYPARGVHVLLFSNPAKAREHGYRDRWEAGQYHYYGEWHGTGDMVLAGGNAAIVDRSPELHLFIAVEGGHRYEGRFECVRYEPERTARDGREFRAIVFVLQRVPAA